MGGIAIKRSIDKAISITVNELIRESVLYAFAHPEEAMEYVKLYAQEMDETVMRQHISLYVNDFTVNLGERGKAAVNRFFEIATERQSITVQTLPAFIC